MYAFKATPKARALPLPAPSLLLAALFALNFTLGCQSTGLTPVENLKPLPTLVADTAKSGPNLGALPIERVDQLVGGAGASGQIGDFLLYNAHIRVVISQIGHADGVAASGGNPIDIALSGKNHDELGEVFTYLDDTFPRQLIYEDIKITKSGSDGSRAQISAIGRDSLNPQIYGVTHYSLDANSSQLKMVTELTNTSDTLLREYELGDAIQWGRTQHFAPGYGSELAGRETKGPWVAGLGESVSYAMTAMGVTLRGPHGNGWSDLVIGKVDLPPGGTATYERYITVGNGDMASMLPAIFSIRGEISETVAGSIIESGANYPIPGAKVSAFFTRSGRPYATAKSDARGFFSMALPPDEYRLEVAHPSRQTQGPKTVDLMRGAPAPQILELSAPGLLRYAISDPEGHAMPAKLSLRGLRGTPTPNLGPKYAIHGAQNHIFTLTGHGEIEIPPGHYEITASRGIEFGIQQEEVELKGGEALSFEAHLAREVDTSGYIGADLHQSSHLSPDCSVTLEDVLIANLAEGVEVIVGADDNHIPDYAPIAEGLSPGSAVKVIPGVVLTDPKLGSISVFPMEHQSGAEKGGAPPLGFESAEAALSELQSTKRVIQVNHPREGGGGGYFDIYGLDSSTGFISDPAIHLGFNTIEVFNGKRLRSASTVLRDWFLLLNQGYAFTAVGASDSHTTVTQERGYPRTYIAVENDHPEWVETQDLIRALRQDRAAIVTNGPFIEFSLNDSAQIGEMLTPEDGQVRLDLKVQAPGWIQVDRVEIIANGDVIKTLRTTDPNASVKLETHEDFALTQDTWFVVVARGSQGMDPVVPKYKGTTITPLGFTNPIWVDVDQDGQFSPPYPSGEAKFGYVDIPLKKAGSK